MKYTIKTTDINNILGIVSHIKKRKVIRNSKGLKTGVVLKYEIPENQIEITEEQYNILKDIDELFYTKFIDGEIVLEDEEEKETRLKQREESILKLKEENELKELKELLIKLQPYVTINKKGKELLNG